MGEARRGAEARQDYFGWEAVWGRGESGERLESGEGLELGLGFDYNREVENFEAGEVSFSIKEMVTRVESLKVKLSCIKHREGVRLQLDYDGRAYEGGRMRRLLQQYVGVVQQVVAGKPGRAADLEIVTQEERDRLIYQYNATRREWDGPTCIDEMFEQAAAANPDRVCVVSQESFVSFRAVDEMSNQLGHLLKEMGVGAESVVGICLERGAEVIVALLGVLKAGGAYLVLEGEQPQSRLDYFMRESGASVLVSEAGLEEGFRQGEYRRVIIDKEWRVLRGYSRARVDGGVRGANLAYVIYTSGSSGLAKAVGVEHRQLVNYVRGISERLNLLGIRSYASVSTMSADLGNTAIYSALSNGGTLHLIGREDAVDSQRLGQYLTRHSVECLKIVPTHMWAMVSEGGERGVMPGKALVLGGETSRWELIEKLERMRKECRIYNHYGPTEATIGVMTNLARVEEKEEGSKSVPIGRPLANTRIYLLDEQQEVVGEGEKGEIYIGGEGLARGYINSAEKTAESYVPDRYSREAGARMYRSGDVGRYVGVGRVEYEGRRDEQMKIRGYRVEPGEIEVELEEMEEVEEARVIGEEDERGEVEMVAYVVPNREKAGKVRKQLRYEREGRIRRGQVREIGEGLVVIEINGYETEYLYEEIFEQKVYDGEGMRVEAGEVVMDIGANIGMYSLYVGMKEKGVRIYAFEPIKEVSEVLRMNLEMNGIEAKVYECGISNRGGEKEMDYYPEMTVLSGSYGEKEADKEVVRSYERSRGEGREWREGELEEVLEEKLRSEKRRCEMRRVSEVIREEGIERIGMMKIDVQKSEMEVLEGIEEEEWEKIRQIIVEVHEIEGRVRKVEEKLRSKGYEVKVRQEKGLESSRQYSIYAVREGGVERQDKGRGNHYDTHYDTKQEESKSEREITTQQAFIAQLKERISSRLPRHLEPSRYVLLDELPLTDNGKLDRKRLAEAGRAQARTAPLDLREPTPVEELLRQIWRDVLGVKEMGLSESFFEMGGHSLKATVLMSRVREVFGVEIGLKELFEEATIEGLGRRIQQARAEGRGLEKPPLKAVERQARMELSYAQERLWFLDQLMGSNSVYNIPVALRMSSRIDYRSMHKSLDEMVQRHEGLRTRFVNEEGKGKQVIEASVETRLEEVDLREIEGKRREQESQRVIRQEAGREFDITEAPLIRGMVIRMGASEDILMVTMHHIISDGWSVVLLMKEMAEVYEAARRGREARLEELEVQYVDYAEWQRGWLRAEMLEERMKYWRRQLAGAPEVMELPTDRERRAIASYRGASERVGIRGEVVEEIKRMAGEQKVTLFMWMLTVYKVLLYYYTGSGDIVVGTDVANRGEKGSERIIGFFVNQLVLRSDLGGDPSFEEVMRRVREVCIGAYANQEVPFEKIVEEIRPKRSLSYNPLYQVSFILRQMKWIGGGEEVGGERVKDELTLVMSESEEGMEGVMEYSRELFEEETIRRMSRHYERLVERVVREPKKRLSEIGLLSEEEKEEIIRSLEGVRKEEEGVSFIEEFGRQVRERGSEIALEVGERSYSYEGLNRAGNRIGRELKREGVGREELVMVMAERGEEMIEAIIGIYKAGGAYLGLESEQPVERIRQVMEGSGSRIMVVGKGKEERAGEVIERMGGGKEVRVKRIGEMKGGEEEEEDIEEIEERVERRQLAYVIYTSGSTGKPKGVMIEQGGMMNHLRSKVEEFGLSRRDVIGQTAGVSFDISVWQMLAGMIVGARVRVVGEEEKREGWKLMEEVEKRGITVLEMVPSQLGVILEEGERRGKGREGLKGLRWLIMTGEALGAEQCRRWMRMYPEVKIANAYGPTECSDDVTQEVIEKEPGEEEVRIAIGRAIRNTRIYILDERGEMVAKGVRGEINIGGAGVGRGYIGEGGKTARVYVPDEYGGEEGGRRYRSGDIGRQRKGGEIEYLGRIDQQVKMRGYRIELGEIEEAMRKKEGIREAVVEIREGKRGEKRLIGYIEEEEGEGVKVEEVREHLRERLPDYMVPSRYVKVKEMWRTVSGKIDRRKVVEVGGREEEEEGRRYEGARSRGEEEMVRIWEEVIGVEKVSIHDNFFELGGDSILSVRIVAKARMVGLNLTVMNIFQLQTIAELVELADSQEKGLSDRNPGPLPFARIQQQQDLIDSLFGTEQNIEDVYPLSPMQEGFLYHTISATEAATYLVQNSFPINSDLNMAAFERAWQKVVDRHAILRTAFFWKELEDPIQVVYKRAKLPLDFHDWRQVPEDEQQERLAAFLLEDQRRGFEFSQAPLLRFAIMRLKDDLYQLTWTRHHILLDGWSQPLLMDEAFKFYSSFTKNEEPSLDAPRPYREYIEWLEKQDRGKAEEYWRRMLKGFTMSTPLEWDRKLDSSMTEDEVFDVPQVRLTEKQTSDLQAFARQHQVTVNTLVQGVWALLLSRYSGDRDIIFGATTSGRSAAIPGIESMIGLFINTLPVRARIEPDESVLSWLKGLQYEQAEARQYEYSALIDIQGWSEVPRGQPLFETILVFDNATPGKSPLDAAPRDENQSAAQGSVYSHANTNYPLALITGFDPVFIMTLGYDSHRFDHTTAMRMTEHLRTLLLGMIADPSRPLSELPLLTEADIYRQLVEWNTTRSDFSSNDCVHHLFETQVKKFPNAIALSFEGVRLTYEELNVRANRMAHYLRASGARPEAKVGIYLERSIEMVVALVGVLKSGAAYVALDPAFTKKWLSSMLDQAKVHILLTEEGLLDSLPPLEAKVICLEKQKKEIARRSKKNPVKSSKKTPAENISHNNLACVIFTAAHNGYPVGVAVEHHAITALIERAGENLGSQRLAGVLASNSISFPSSILDLLLPLCKGGRVMLARNAMELAYAGPSEKITLISATPSTLVELVRAVAIPDTVEAIINFGGPLRGNIVRRLYQSAPNAQVFNMYGPAEALPSCTQSTVRPGERGGPTIGRPISGTQIYLLDEFLRHVPIGVAGRLYVGGESLARGYVDQPKKTAGTFIPNPFSREKGARLLRTDDLARYREDGKIEYLRRAGERVKLGGYKIDPQGVEEALSRYPSVDQAVVLTREDSPGQHNLVAYLICDDRFETSTDGLRNHLKSELPEYLLPSAFVLLDSFPLTPACRIDKDLLPLQEIEESRQGGFLPPRDSLEYELTRIWEAILDTRPIGMRDNFFELGGSSLLALRLIAQVYRKLGRIVPIAAMIGEPTVENMANILRQETEVADWSPLVALQPEGKNPPLFVAHAVDGQVLGYMDLARLLGPDQPCYGLQARGLIEGQEPMTGIEDMAAGYIEALRSLQSEGPYHLAGWSVGGLIAYEMAQQLGAQGQKVGLLALLDTHLPAINKELDYQTLFNQYAARLVSRFAEQLSLSTDHLQRLDLDAQLNFVVEQARNADILPSGMGGNHFRRMIALNVSNILAVNQYRVRDYTGDVLLFRALDEVDDNEPQDLGWGEVVKGSFKVYSVAGSHAKMMSDPIARELARIIKDYLTKSTPEQYSVNAHGD